MYKFHTNYSKIYENIVASTFTYIDANKIKSLIIGMSGGIDSTLTAALAYEIAKLFDGQLHVIGNIIDIESEKDEIKRGIESATMFCHSSEYTDLKSVFWLLSEDVMGLPLGNDLKSRTQMGNIKARLRMIKLYDLAKKHDGLVLSTDNYTEYLLGFWTLHGDVGDFGMLQNLWKTEVYGMATYLQTKFYKLGKFGQADAIRSCIEAMPTDGLGITNSDFDQLCPEASKNGSPAEVYNKIDTLLYNSVIEQKPCEDEVILRYRNTKFKRSNPLSIPREYIVSK